jgi:5-(carboxyamino)imidazole ribonucleotide synthase
MKLPRVGMLGGGQLGRMFIQEAQRFNLSVDVLELEEKVRPCLNTGSAITIGDCLDYEAVYNFGTQFDVLVCEKEQVHVPALFALDQVGVQVIPDPHVLNTTQNKYTQKVHFRNHSIPTADFSDLSILPHMPKDIIPLYPDYVFPIYHKLFTGGYDGRGVSLINSQWDKANIFDVKESFIEQYIDVKHEISILAAQHDYGEVAVSSAIEMVMTDTHMLDYLIVPSSLSSEMEEKCEDIAFRLVDSFDHRGLYAIEMLIDQNDNVYVNEVSPRFHNSGHWTIEGASCSQYEQMVRLILDLPLGSYKNLGTSLTCNLISGKRELDLSQLPDDVFDNVYIHLYNKSSEIPNRKIGHVTMLGEKDNREDIFYRFDTLKDYFIGEK